MSEEKKTPRKAQDTQNGAAEVVTTPAEKNASDAVVTAEQKETFVYVGPSLPNGALKNGSVFNGTRSAVLTHLRTIAPQHPEVEQLLVSSEKLAEAKTKIQAGGNLMAVAYGKLADKIKKK